MNLKRLRKLIQDTAHLPDNTPVLRSGRDHDYTDADIELGEALYDEDEQYYSETYYKWKQEDTPNLRKVEAIIVSQY